MGAAHRIGHRIQPRRNGDEVDVVGHQAETESLQLRLAGIPGKEIQVSRTVFVVGEDVTTEVATLGYLVWATNGQHAS